MKRIYSFIMIAAALTMLWGCSSDDNDHGGKTNDDVILQSPPVWKVDLVMPEGDIEGKPDWKEVNPYLYESSMTAIIFLQNAFDNEITPDDRMAAIVNGEVRELVAPVEYVTYTDGSVLYTFMLYIPFTQGDDEVEIQYYNAKRNQTYRRPNFFSVKDDTVGSEDTFYMTFIPEKSMMVGVPFEGQPFTPTENDQLAFFIGDVCCGVAQRQGEVGTGWGVQFYQLVDSHEKIHARYYSADKQTVYKTEPFIELDEDEGDVMQITLRFR